MKIKQLTIDSKDMKQAVEAFLKTKGIDLLVHSIAKEYSWKDDWEVTFQFEVQPAPKTPASAEEAAPPRVGEPLPTDINTGTTPQEANVF